MKKLQSFIKISLITVALFICSAPLTKDITHFNMNNTDSNIKTLAVLIFPDFELLDVFGPLEMFGNLPDKIKVILVAEKTGPVASAQGPAILAEQSIETDIKFDWILIPGGIGTRREVNNPKLTQWIKAQAEQSQMVLTVCTGAALLAKTGILDGHKATTNKMAFDWVKSQGPNVHWQPKARWVQDGNVITSSGVAAGTDMSLFVITQQFGQEVANHIIKRTEYIWNSDPNFDPFAQHD